MQKGGAVYIMASPNRTSLYTGVTSNLYKRVHEHRNKLFAKSHTAKYNCVELVYYRWCDSIEAAILEEKRIKATNRMHKEGLILKMNPEWRDLWLDLEPW